jgi:hypothetical protein
MKSLLAKDVPIVKIEDLYGEGIDGILRMSFMSRFDVTITSKSIRIKPRSDRATQ